MKKLLLITALILFSARMALAGALFVPSKTGDLDDWKNASQAGGQCAIWNATDSKWENQACPSGAGGQPIVFIGFANQGVAASAITYFSIAGPQSSYSAGEVNQRIFVPVSCTLKNLYASIGRPQDSTGSLILTLLKNSTATALTVTFPAGSAQATMEKDITDTVSVTAGDYLDFKLANNATVTSADIIGTSLECQ
ncbi:MAG: hypothetical protein M0Z48_00605 [Nitrospiraceae bacterium]|nr:hypothetical protein [Nitrospiraceae bacterium]